MEEVFNIVSKKVTGVSLTPDEELLFRDWFAITENQTIYKDLEQVWRFTGDVTLQLNCNVDEEWNLFKEKAGLNKVRPFFSRQIYRISAIAASIVLFIGLFSVLFFANSNGTVYRTASQSKKIELPDHSIVWLNANSEITVNKNYNSGNRNVALAGEAFFEIQKNENLPFVITMDNGLQARVLGTSFNIQANKKSEVWTLNVFSGKVWIGAGDKEALVVDKEQQAVFDTHKKILVRKDTFNSNANAWKTKELQFNNTPIEEVALQLSQYLGKQVVLPSQIEHLRYSGSFSNPSEKDIAKVIALALGWQYKITNKALIFTEKAEK